MSLDKKLITISYWLCIILVFQRTGK